MPTEKPPVQQDNSATEALIVSHEKHAKVHTQQHDTMIRQQEKNNPVPVLEAIIVLLQQIRDRLPPVVNSDAPPEQPGA